jgi:lipopolysaccharide export system protein LptA
MRRLLLALLLLGTVGVQAAGAQDRSCRISQEATGRAEQVDVGGTPLIILHDPFVVRCNDGAELRANSGRLNQATRELHLVGNVFFQDAEQTLTAAEATYNSVLARLWATGNVVFVNRQDGSTLRGPELEYLRETEERPLAQVNAGQRPELVVRQRDGAPEAEPLTIVADRVIIVGEDDLTAIGDAEITRSDFRATGGQARYDSASETLDLRERATIRSDDYDLVGESIVARLAEGALEHVHARQRAALRGEELRVTAAELQLYFARDTLQRLVARAPEGSEEGRALALSRNFRIEADSLDAAILDQQLERVDAVGNAQAETIDSPEGVEVDLDSLDAERLAADRASPAERDWIRGDTIIAYFEAPDNVAAGTPEVAEERPSTELRRLVAVGRAQSLYRLEPDSPAARAEGRKNINFLVGDAIELTLQDGELSLAEVRGLQRGIYLEADPNAPAAAPGPGPAPEPAADDPLQQAGDV